jgi:nucleoside-diphosphate-sugar epimerase
MLTHGNEQGTAAPRVVVLGAKGFLGQAVIASAADAGLEVLAVERATVDLATAGADAALTKILRPGDSVVVLAALTPDRGRGLDVLLTNLRIIQSVVGAMQQVKCSQLVYVSSDAVYGTFHPLISEATAADPVDLYGVMHRTRELAVALPDTPVAILRPTLIYGAGDTHNSYGPNRFRRMATEKGEIVLFGGGEETRDHIYVGDAAQLVVQVVRNASSGLLNLATGRSISYADLAAAVVGLYGGQVTATPRQNPVTHRSFDVTAVVKAFPDFRFTTLEEGLRKTKDAQDAGRS